MGPPGWRRTACLQHPGSAEGLKSSALPPVTHFRSIARLDAAAVRPLAAGVPLGLAARRAAAARLRPRAALRRSDVPRSRARRAAPLRARALRDRRRERRARVPRAPRRARGERRARVGRDRAAHHPRDPPLQGAGGAAGELGGGVRHPRPPLRRAHARPARGRRHPRTGFEEGIVEALADGVRAKPETAYASWQIDVLEATTPGYVRPNFCEVLRSTRFAI
jgi:hypothetical protein